MNSIARASEELVLKFNPAWTAANYDGRIPAMPNWAAGRFQLVGMFFFDAEIPFTQESWRGRFRACRGVGATLSADELFRFDEEHAELLSQTTTEQFTVKHRIDCHILQPIAP